MDFICCTCDKMLSLFNLIWSFLTDNNMKVIELGLTAWGCYIALRGLNTWRQQVINQPKIELAREVMEMFYQIHDIICKARVNMLFYSRQEMQEYYDAHLTKEQYSCLARYKIIDEQSDLISKFKSLRYKIKIYFNGRIDKDFNYICYIIDNLKESYAEYYDELKLSKEERTERKNTTHYRQREELMFWHEGDELYPQLNALLKRVEKELTKFYCKDKELKDGEDDQ